MGNKKADDGKDNECRKGGLAGAADAIANGAAHAVADGAGKVAGAVAAGVKKAHQAVGGEYGDRFEGNLKNEHGEYVIPEPLIDQMEEREIDRLIADYEKMTSPSVIAKAGQAIADAAPDSVKEIAGKVGGFAKDTFDGLTQQELIADALKVVSEGFGDLEEQVAEKSIGAEYVLRTIDEGEQAQKVSSLDEICLLRSYDVARIAKSTYGQHKGAAVVEGGATGAAGFWGIPFNFALSMLVYFRAVQSVAMFYGYDVKNDPEELVIAGEVFTKSLSPGSRGGASNDYVGKILMFADAAAIKQCAKKGWTAMAEKGGIALLIAQMRALANKTAQKAVEGADKKAIEAGIFKEALTQVGTELTLKNIVAFVPIAGGAVGALFDLGQMRRILEFADVFYHKRFLVEKAERVHMLTGVTLDGEDPLKAEAEIEQ